MTKLDVAARHPNWKFAERVLSLVIPGAGSFQLDDVPGLEPRAWADFPIDDVEPAVVNQALLEYCRPLMSALVVIATTTSHRESVGPFFLLFDSLGPFIDWYIDQYDDVFLAEDLLIVCPSRGHVVAVHHNGLIATLKGRTTTL